MPVQLVTPPAAEPLTLAEAKAWLRLDTADDDALVTGLVATARAGVESACGRLLLSQTWRWVMDRWPPQSPLAVPLSPLRSVTSIIVTGPAGATTTVPAADYAVDAASDPPRIALLRPPPAPVPPLAGIAITLVVGVAATPATLPEPLRQAVRLMLAALYENRGEAETPPLPATVVALVAPWRRRRL